MRILLTGARGTLGQEVMKYFSDKYDVYGTGKEEIDITNIESIINYVGDLRPDILINCAAVSSADDAEENMLHAFKLNAIGAKNLAIASNMFNFKLVHLSSDHVFDGTSENAYIETDDRKAINVLGKSKIDGENFIRHNSNKYFIIRTQWLFGMDRNDLVKEMLKKAKTENNIKVTNDQLGCPTYVKDLLVAIEELMVSMKYGTYHITNQGFTSWYEFTKMVYNIAGITNVNLISCDSKEIQHIAPRPKNRVLKGFYWELEGFTPLRIYQKALQEYMKEL